MNKKLIAFLCVILLTALTFASCSAPEKQPENNRETVEPTSPEAAYDNALCAALAEKSALILPADPGEYLLASSKKLQSALKAAGFDTVRAYEGKLSEAAKALPAIIFGRAGSTPADLYEGLGAADFTLALRDGTLFVTGGSDYALGTAAEKLPELLLDPAFAFPYTYRAPQNEQVKVLRVATFNIQNGAGVSHKFDRLGDYIKNLKIDIIGLQEVDMNTTRDLNQDTMKLLSESTGMAYYGFSKAISFGGGEYGSGVLSRYPILSYETETLPRGGGDETRSFGHAVIDVDGVQIDFFNTHLTLSDENRGAQWAQIAAPFLRSERAIITGDLNRDGTEDYDQYFAKTCNYANGNDGIGFEEGCTLVSKGENPNADVEAEKKIVKQLYALKDGERLEGTYTLTGKVTGVVNVYPGSDDVTVHIIVGKLSDKTIRCFKMKGENAKSLQIGDTITVTGTLINKRYTSSEDDAPRFFHSCPGWGALDNIISNAFFTQLDARMDAPRRAISDHYLIWADLAFPCAAAS